MRKIFVKVMALALALVMSISVLSGCQKAANDKNEQGQTVISVGNWPDKEGKELETYEARKARFESENTDVVVEPDLWKFERKTFYAKAAGAQLPVLYNAGFTEVPEIISSEYSADLTDALKKHGIYDSINPVIMDAISDENGRVMVFPITTSVMGLMINMDLMKEAGLVSEDGTPNQPKTWDEVLEYAKIIKEKTGKPGFVIPTAGNSGGWLFTCLAWSFGADFMEKDKDGKWQATFNTPEVAEALQFIKDMKWKHDVVPANSLIDAKEWQKIFGSGEAGITFGAGDYPASTLAAYGMQPNSIGLVAIPKGPKKHVTLITGNITCISSSATEDQIDAGVRWLKMNYNPTLTENVKISVKETIETKTVNNKPVGIIGMSVWKSDAESNVYSNNEFINNTNININNVRLYNEFAANPNCEIRPEEPVCCQELYSILDSCIQEVLTNKDADCKAVLEKVNSDFQKNYLDNLIY